MSLPREFIDELRNCASLAQLAGRHVAWDERKSSIEKGDLWGPCPFHHGSSASFHVDEKKGFYYCFDCHAKGDVFSFVCEMENVGFIEAVGILAHEAGVPMPETDQKLQANKGKRNQLFDVMESAVRFFRLRLDSTAGTKAREFLNLHGLTKASQDRFEVGFALDAWQGLWDHLKTANIPDELILDCGLAKPSSKDGRPYDTFRGRIVFPIRDFRGSCIAFGSWAISHKNNPEFLFSPNTKLFDRSSTLFNQSAAREAVGKGQPLLVTSHFIETVELVQCGFEAAVSPIGTAMTEAHLRELWRISSEPIIVLASGDNELRYASRLIDLALPLISEKHSLRFATMPDDESVISLFQRTDPAAMSTIVKDVRSTVEMLWKLETKGRCFDSPERKAALDKAINRKIKQIRDPKLRSLFGQSVKELRRKLFKKQKRKKNLSILPSKSGWKPQDDPREEAVLDYIVCECACGKKSRVSADKLKPLLPGKLTASKARSLVPKLRCAECRSSPIYVFDDKKNLLFGPS